MSSEPSLPAIEVRGVGKSYNIYADPMDRLRQAVAPRLGRALRRLGLPVPAKTYFSVFHALHGIDFKVERGETVGIIGRNGAGKSTLLQLVCGTLTPSEGEVDIRGRVAALLELGSGFNPEYTGRENVFLNASVLGLSRAETEARLADILAFADIGEFVDQPVKTYSSGMAMRLAFSVIAHVDADLLVVDEALGVGDAQFQQKCMRWLRGFREHGTVLFCSHDLGAVMSLCHRAIWLEGGRMRMHGPAKEVAEAYLAAVQAEVMGLDPEAAARGKRRAVNLEAPEEAAAPQPDREEGTAPTATRPIHPGDLPPPPEPTTAAVFNVLAHSASFGSGEATIEAVHLTREDGSPPAVLQGGELLRLEITVRAHASLSDVIIGFHAKDRLGQPLFGGNTLGGGAGLIGPLEPRDAVTASFRFRLPTLMSGRYSLTAAVASGTLAVHVQHHWVHDALMFDVHSPRQDGVLLGLPLLGVQVQAAEAGTGSGNREA